MCDFSLSLVAITEHCALFCLCHTPLTLGLLTMPRLFAYARLPAPLLSQWTPLFLRWFFWCHVSVCMCLQVAYLRTSRLPKYVFHVKQCRNLSYLVVALAGYAHLFDASVFLRVFLMRCAHHWLDGALKEKRAT